MKIKRQKSRLDRGYRGQEKRDTGDTENTQQGKNGRKHYRGYIAREIHRYKAEGGRGTHGRGHT